MTQPDALQQATMRLNAALDVLESFSSHIFAKGEGGVSVAALQQQVHLLNDERDRLLQELDTERARVRRLEAANDEVSDRLETAVGTLREIMPAMPG